MIAFKTAQEKEDFDNNPRVKAKLKDLLTRLDAFCVANNIPGPYITDVLREDKRSQHFYGEAFDMRLLDISSDGTRTQRYTLQQFAQIYNFLEENFQRTDKVNSRRARVAYAHGEDENFHLHISIDKEA